jgi:DNA-binding NarL/FixJ family response regulator
LKALLVEDEGLTREGLALLIQVVDPTVLVTAVASGEEARRRLRDESFDFIFLDVRLGAESGLALLESLKDDGIAAPVIMLSAQDDRETVMEALSAGAFGFVPKQSENPAVIRQAMELALRGGVYLPPSVRGRGGTAPPPSAAGVARLLQIRQVASGDLGLPPRLYETVYYVSQGLTNKAIARKMGISDTVVAEYVRTAFQRLNVAGRPGFMVLLNRSGWQLQPPPGSRDELVTKAET